MSRPGWLLPLIKLTFPKNWERVGRFIAPSPIARAVRKAMFDGDHLLCVPHDRTAARSAASAEPRRGRVLEVGVELARDAQVVVPSALCDYLIDRMDYHVVMNFCICRRSNDCADYPRDYGCLFMGDAARGINPEWGRPVSRDEAKAHLRKCEETGLIHFLGKAKLDALWLGVGPGEKLLGICSCCPCCCITRGLPYFPADIAKILHRAPGVEVSITEDCNACGKCATQCFAHAITVDDERASISDQCRGCGRCVERCPQSAIRLDIDPSRFIAESAEQLARVVDIPGPR